MRSSKWGSSRSAVRSAGEAHDNAIHHKMPPYMPDKPSLTRTVTFNPAPDVTSGSETATLDTETPLEQHLEQESSGQQCFSLAVLNLVRKDTFTHKRGTRIPRKISERSNTVDLPETLHEKKEYSRSKTEKRRNSRENERKNCEIRNVPTAVDRTVSSSKILGLFVTKVPIDTWHNKHWYCTMFRSGTCLY
jgi:hypothetical protein